MILRLFKQIKKYKIIAGAIFLLFVGGAYWGYLKIFGNNDSVRYVLARVQKGNLIFSVTGNGQVSAFNQIDAKSKASGEIVAIYANSGQEIREGAILAIIDTRDAERAVRDAETALETAKLELEKMLEPVDALTLLQAENSLAQAKELKQKAEDNLKKAYEDGFNVISNAFLNLPEVMTGLQDILFSNSLSGGGQWNIDYYADAVKSYDGGAVLRFKEDLYSKHRTAREAYDKNFLDYKSASRFSERATIEQLINQTYETTKLIAEAIKSAKNLIHFYQDKLTENNLKPLASSNTHLLSLNSYTSITNNHLLNLLSIKRSIEDSKEALVNAERTIEERALFLDKIKRGPDELDIRAKKIAIKQKEDALVAAKQALADHYIRAPFSGIVAKVNVKKGDSVSVGTPIATLITKQKIAEISLNEVDITKVKIGQKAMLTFDAIPDLTVTGQIAEVDTVGTVSQGVVTYTAKVNFDTGDERVKTAMSVSATIVTEVKPNVLLVPNSAVKSQGKINYVEVVDGSDYDVAFIKKSSGTILKNPPRRQNVEIGSSNDEFAEILSGLKEGDIIVIRTIQENSAQQQNKQQVFGIPGMPNTRSGSSFRSGAFR